MSNRYYNCPRIQERVTIQRVYENFGGIGSNQVERVLQAEICSKERTCQHLTNCPIRSVDQE
jgi:hypothetical protein